MRAPLRLVLLTLTALLVALAILSHYRNNVYTQTGNSLSTWSRPTWASLHPSNWVPSFHSGSSKAEIEEQWRLKEQALGDDEKDDKKTSGLGSAGGSGEDDMSDEQRAKALDRLKKQYGDDDADKSKGTIDWHSVVAPPGGKEDKNKVDEGKTDKQDAKVDEGATIASSSSTSVSATASSSSSTPASASSSSLSGSSSTTYVTHATNATSLISTTLTTSTTKASTSSDEWAYLSELEDGPSPTSTASYEHLDSQALNTGLETHVAASDASSTTSVSSTPSSVSGFQVTATSSPTKNTDRSGFVTLTTSHASTSTVDLDKAAYDYLSEQSSSTSAEPPHVEKPATQELHAFDNLRDLGIE